MDIHSPKHQLVISQTVHLAAFRLTFGDITDLVLKVRPTTAPGHVFKVEALI